MLKKSGQAENILHSAALCLCEHGYANVSTRDIARRAGVALSQLTYYYKSKENLFSAVMREMTEKFLTDLDALIVPTLGENENLTRFIGYFEALCQAEPKRMRLFVDFVGQSLWSGAFAAQLREFFLNLQARVRPFIKRAQGADFSEYLVGSVYGLATQSLFAKEKETAAGVFAIAKALTR